MLKGKLLRQTLDKFLKGSEVAVVAVVAVDALPFKVAVIVLAEKLPEASRRTNVDAPFEALPVV